jgi:hypothetical protein
MQNESQPVQMPQVQAGDETLIILESLLCVMREEPADPAGYRIALPEGRSACGGISKNPLPCCPEKAENAKNYLHRLSAYIGQRYGGKHLRRVS